MAIVWSPGSRLRRHLRKNTYVYRGQLFFPSQRGFDKLARTRGVSAPENFSVYEKVFVTVTLGWWLQSYMRLPTNIHAIVVPTPFGRFGNQTLQLAHSLCLADFFEAKDIITPGNEIVHETNTALPSGQNVTTTEASVRPPRFRDLFRALLSPGPPVAHLVGNFFYTTAFREGTVTPDSRTEAYRAVRTIASNIPQVAGLPRDHLVIHLRGGDAFGPHAHNEYGQPPLAFYQLVLDDAPWSKVTIVTADELNPTLPHIIEEARARGLACSVHSGSLEEDVTFLLSASTLVSSRSTFIPALTAFSDHASDIYVFGEEDRFSNQLTLKRVIDAVGTYWTATCEYNWADEPWQRELMLNYPADNLAWQLDENL